MKTDIICTRLASIDGANTVFLNLVAHVKNTDAIEIMFTSVGPTWLLANPFGELSA